LTNRSFVARPTEGGGFTGVYVHQDASPEQGQLALLLAAYQYRFAGDLEAMSRHLIDDVPIGWLHLGTDLLDGAPTGLRLALAGEEDWPSAQFGSGLLTTDGAPPVRMTVTGESAGEFETGYVLHPHGVEVFAHGSDGLLVPWDTHLLRVPDALHAAAARAISPSRRGRPPAPGPGTASPSTGAGRPGPAPRTR
jgi:hypothetical protein